MFKVILGFVAGGICVGIGAVAFFYYTFKDVFR